MLKQNIIKTLATAFAKEPIFCILDNLVRKIVPKIV